MTTTSLSDAKARLSDLVSSAEETHERTTITKNGKPAAVLMSCDDLDGLLSTIEVLSDPDALASFAESEITTRHGLRYEMDEVWDGQHTYSPEESERRVIARMGQDAYDQARAAIRADLLAHPDANVRERARNYGS